MHASIVPSVVHRLDYKAPAFLVSCVDLTFELGLARTQVRSIMQVTRADNSPEVADLRLDGIGLTLLSVLVDGRDYREYVVETDSALVLKNVPDAFTLEITSVCEPEKNTALMGLYASKGGLFTQCEPEGFRRIAYSIDRPDVLSVYTVTLIADRGEFPVLLSNGNLLESAEQDDGRHRCVWHDPFPKATYLFALVAADLVVNESWLTTQSGHDKQLQIWVRAADIDKTDAAMNALIAAIRWDEAVFGLELDLDRFMIVAVDDFNMGAMENKGLNIFNSQAVLASSDTATDANYSAIETIVAHEYFHNWTGNRVTCRDWFQLSLKEGLTVYRDQEFSADMAKESVAGVSAGIGASAIKRIDSVNGIRHSQFLEDAGPNSHSIRPNQYSQINNFYTSTIYGKGAELIRMLATVVGETGFRRGMDLYFARHDGQAVTCDDFLKAIADGSGVDLSRFDEWYQQAGTPVVKVDAHLDTATQQLTLTLSQTNPRVPADAAPLPMPFTLGLIRADGSEIPVPADGSYTPNTLLLTQREQTYVFPGVTDMPRMSLLRNFSAPVKVDYRHSTDDLLYLLANDHDSVNQWDAGQQLYLRMVLETGEDGNPVANEVDRFISVLGQLLCDERLAPAFRARLLAVPGEKYLAEQMPLWNPVVASVSRTRFVTRLAKAHSAHWRSIHALHHRPQDALETHAAAMGHRALKNTALYMLAMAGHPEAEALAQEQYRAAGNMTDRFAALHSVTMLADMQSPDHVTPVSELDDFQARYAHEPLVINKWFGLQASRQLRANVMVPHIHQLMALPTFDMRNVNRYRAVVFGFCLMNPMAFHSTDGAGYRFWAEQTLVLDRANPQVASNLARGLAHWRRFVPVLGTAMARELNNVARDVVSSDVKEIIMNSLKEPASAGTV